MTVGAHGRCRESRARPHFEIGISEKVRFLSEPASYPERPMRVEVIETHYSWVFLTDWHAYKLKKPVLGRGFDFRTVEARRRNAVTECSLNRRLAGGVYLGVVPLNLRQGRELTIGGTGIPVDWLVKMIRLPADRMLNRRIAIGEFRRGDIGPIARHLAGFFATARRAKITDRQFLRRIRSELADARRAFLAEPHVRQSSAVHPVAHRLEAFLVRRAALFEQRIRYGHLVDGHGDLRPEHVYVNGTPRIIDCLEFRVDLRQHDPVDELAYLSLECRRLGGPDILPRLLSLYTQRTGDKPALELVHFYTALNATIRARLAIEHLAEPGAHSPEEWKQRAADYLVLAAKECGFLSR